jgi:hypothetical protein
MTVSDKTLDEQLIEIYRSMVREKHVTWLGTWPLLSGYNVRHADFPGGSVVIFEHTANPNMRSSSGLGTLDASTTGVPRLTMDNAMRVRETIERRFHLKPQDGVLVLVQQANGELVLPGPQLDELLHKHAQSLGLTPMKIFLSHKGVDKEMVRRFERLLRTFGFDPWLDDDAMPAGSQPDRAIMQGFKDSCAAVFFVTPDFKDEKWLATEVEYARTEKREKGDKFSIITLCLSKDGAEGVVPKLLENYIYKKPTHELEAMLEIARALPIRVGEPRFRT